MIEQDPRRFARFAAQAPVIAMLARDTRFLIGGNLTVDQLTELRRFRDALADVVKQLDSDLFALTLDQKEPV